MPNRDMNPLGPDTKPMLQNGMITGYPNSGNSGGPCFTGKFHIIYNKCFFYNEA